MRQALFLVRLLVLGLAACGAKDEDEDEDEDESTFVRTRVDAACLDGACRETLPDAEPPTRAAVVDSRVRWV